MLGSTFFGVEIHTSTEHINHNSYDYCWFAIQGESVAPFTELRTEIVQWVIIRIHHPTAGLSNLI